MPLIILSGLPTSGKSTRAAQLYAHFTERIARPSPSLADGPAETNKKTPPYRLHLISDESLSISRTVYDLSALPAHARSANALEKDARASIYGAVKRVLTDKDIVILDGLNYIKGWRYQLYCEAKAVRTPSVVLQIGCSRERSHAVNEARLARRSQTAAEGRAEKSSITPLDSQAGVEQCPEPSEATPTLADDDRAEPYEPANWENLVFRYEEPNPMTRWDSPLFALVWEDDEVQTRKVFDDVWETIAGVGRSAVKPNRATVPRTREAGGDYLYVLDRETQDIVKRILDAQQQGDDGGGDSITVPREGAGASSGTQMAVFLPGKKVGLPQLQRLRRAFVGLNRGGIGLEGVGDFSVARMRESFVAYLNDSFEKDE